MLKEHSPITQALLGTLFTWALTAAGAALVVVIRGKQVSSNCYSRVTRPHSNSALPAISVCASVCKTSGLAVSVHHIRVPSRSELNLIYVRATCVLFLKNSEFCCLSLAKFFSFNCTPLATTAIIASFIVLSLPSSFLFVRRKKWAGKRAKGNSVKHGYIAKSRK